MAYIGRRYSSLFTASASLSIGTRQRRPSNPVLIGRLGEAGMSDRILRRRRSHGPGFTIVEMMIAMVLTLIMVYAIAEFYAYVGETVKDGRAMIEISGAVRNATQRLKADLDLRTVKLTPPIDDATASGYFCLTEGICNDAAPNPATLGQIDADSNSIPDIGQDTNQDGIVDYLETYDLTNLLGDSDDVLAFTIRNDIDPFVAQVATVDLNTGVQAGIAVQSASLAEVCWWTSFTDNPTFATTGSWDPGETRTLHRRLLLIRPDVNQVHPGDMNYSGPYYIRWPGNNPQQALYELLQVSDVSVRPIQVANGYVYFSANSLADLTRRENRFMNTGPGQSAAFPNSLDLNPHFAGDATANPWDAVNNASLFRWNLSEASGRRGEDIVLSNILAFDVRVFDSTAVLLADSAGAVTLQPGDPGYAMGVGTYTQLGTGGFVDLNYSRYLAGLGATYPVVTTGHSFYGNPQAKSLFPATTAVYDTWAASYERDGLNQDYAADGAANINTAPFDEGTNGLDDDNQNGVDDAGERETLPPYPAPLRGIEIRVRVYEPGTRQSRQATLNADFVAE
jgi:type II secretory pathway pseudopilin PulG